MVTVVKWGGGILVTHKISGSKLQVNCKGLRGRGEQTQVASHRRGEIGHAGTYIVSTRGSAGRGRLAGLRPAKWYCFENTKGGK